MVLFLVVISINLKTVTIIKGLRIFLGIGLFQGLYGIYQVIGGPFGWPTYQSLTSFLPTAGDKTVDGFLYSGALGLFRATGFFPGDVSHYGSFMACIIILTLTFILTDPRSKFLKIVLFVSVLALFLALSRSAFLALVLFGLPTGFVLGLKLRYITFKTFMNITKYIGVFIIIILLLWPRVSNFIDFDIIFFFQVILRRLADLINAGVDPQGSMSIHVLTRLQALDAFSQYPFFGVGLGVNASPWFSELYNAGWAGSHSHHLDILGQTGMLGAMLEWLFMLVVVYYIWKVIKIKRVRRDHRLILAGLFSSIIFIIFGNLFYHFFLNDFVWYLFATGIALSRSIMTDVEQNGITQV